MTLTVEATYEDGVLGLSEPVPLKDHDKVQVTIHTGASRAELSAGLLRWTGDPAILRRIAEDDDFGILETP